MPLTYDPISTTTLSSATATVTFSSIPQTYTDLVLIVSGTMSGSGNTIYARLNGDSGANYSQTYIGGTGSASYTGRSANNTAGVGLGSFYTGYSTSLFSIVANFQYYSNTTSHKTVLSNFGQPTGGAQRSVETLINLWRNTSAITSIEVRPNTSHNFNSGSTFTLYGIKAA